MGLNTLYTILRLQMLTILKHPAVTTNALFSHVLAVFAKNLGFFVCVFLSALYLQQELGLGLRGTDKLEM